MSGFIGGDQALHYAYGAARSIGDGEWDPFLDLIVQAVMARQGIGPGVVRPPTMADFLTARAATSSGAARA